MDCSVCYEPFVGELGPTPRSDRTAPVRLVPSATVTSGQLAQELGTDAASSSAPANPATAPSRNVNDILEVDPSPVKRRRLTPASVRKTSQIICTPCGHLFHRACITGWMNKRIESPVNGASQQTSRPKTLSGTCPSCRTKFRDTSLYPVYFGVERRPPPPPPVVTTHSSPSSIIVTTSRDVLNASTPVTFIKPVGLTPKILPTPTSTSPKAASTTPGPKASTSNTPVPKASTSTAREPKTTSTSSNSDDDDNEGNERECLRTKCRDTTLMLSLIQSDFTELQKRLQETITKYEEANDLAMVKDLELEEYKQRVRLLIANCSDNLL